MTASEGFTVRRLDDTREVVAEGAELTVDSNLPVTFVGIASEPWGDDATGEYHTGRITVRYSWGAVEEVDDHRAGVSVDEV